MSKLRRAEHLQNTWHEVQRPWVYICRGRFGGTEETTELGHMKSLGSPDCHSLAMRVSSKRGGPEALKWQGLSMHGS